MTTTPTNVKPALRRRVKPASRSPVTVIRSVERLVLRVAVDVDDSRDGNLARVLRRIRILLHREDPVRGLGHRIDRDLPHVAVLDEELERRRELAAVTLVLVDEAAEGEEVRAQRRLAGALGRVAQRGNGDR